MQKYYTIVVFSASEPLLCIDTCSQGKLTVNNRDPSHTQSPPSTVNIGFHSTGELTHWTTEKGIVTIQPPRLSVN